MKFRLEQFFFSLLILSGLIFSSLSFIYEQKIETEIQPQRKQVTSIFCTSQKTGSRVLIKDNEEGFSVEVPSQQCYSIKQGSYINVFYNKYLNYFFLKGHSKIYKTASAILFFAFIISLLPWRKWFL